VIGLVNEFSRPQDVVLCAAGSLPGDLHKLWRTRDPKGYHLEYGYSTMGYEIAGGLGVKMADPSREVYVMVGDGSYLMMNSEIVTAMQEGFKLTIILLNNYGFASIGGLSKSVGSDGFGTKYRYRTASGELDGEVIELDFAANAASLGAQVLKACTRQELAEALETARGLTQLCVLWWKQTAVNGWAAMSRGGMWPWLRSQSQQRCRPPALPMKRPRAKSAVIKFKGGKPCASHW
jgi:Acetolactate synthase